MPPKAAKVVSSNEEFLIDCFNNQKEKSTIDWNVVAQKHGISTGGAQNKLRALLKITGAKPADNNAENSNAAVEDANPPSKRKRAPAKKSALQVEQPVTPAVTSTEPTSDEEENEASPNKKSRRGATKKGIAKPVKKEVAARNGKAIKKVVKKEDSEDSDVEDELAEREDAKEEVSAGGEEADDEA